MTSDASRSGTLVSLPDRLDTPFYRALVKLGLFHPLRRVSRTYYRLRTQRRALKGKGLVIEGPLKATYAAALVILRQKLGYANLGDYVEFGVCHGSSMACMHDMLENTTSHPIRMFGFDSFEGLPPEADFQDNGIFSRGQFDSSERFTRWMLTRRGIDWSRTFLIRGWFKDTLNQQTIEEYGISRVSIALIDCDIYSASKEALDFVAPLLTDHAILVFDDWHYGDMADQNLGEARAFSEFAEQNRERFLIEQLPPCYPNSAVFLLTRTKGSNDS